MSVFALAARALADGILPAQLGEEKRRLSTSHMPAHDAKAFRGLKSVSARDAAASGTRSNNNSRPNSPTSSNPGRLSPKVGSARLSLPAKRAPAAPSAPDEAEDESSWLADSVLATERSVEEASQDMEPEAVVVLEAAAESEAAAEPKVAAAAAADSVGGYDEPASATEAAWEAAAVAAAPARAKAVRLPLDKMKPHLLELPLDEKKKLAKMLNDMIEVDELRAMYSTK